MQRGLHQKIIKNSQFQNRVNQWIRQYDPLRKDPSYQYKFSLSKILPLADNLLLNVILYTSYANFPFLLEDLTPQIKINTSLYLKQIYTSEFYSGKWKQDFYFQFTMIYLIKTVSNFIEEHFPKLDINENLESQMYIILNNVFIGTEVGTKLYHVTAKKYIKYLNPKVSKKKQLSKQKKVSILTTFPCKPSSKQINDSLHSQVSNGTKQKILNVNFNINNLNLGRFGNYLSIRRHPRRHKISFLRQKVDVPKEKSQFEIFVGDLKKSLHVDPLPVIKVKKVDIGEYVGMKNVGKELNLCEDREQIEQSFSKSLYLAKGKISSSMQTIVQLNHPGILTRSMSKDNWTCNKIALFRQLNSKHYSLTQTNGNKTNVSKNKSLVEIKCGKSDTQLSGVKNNSGMMPKVNGKLTLEDLSQLLRKIKINSKNNNSSEKENYLMGKNRTRKSLSKNHLHTYSRDNSSNNKNIPTNLSSSNLKTQQKQKTHQVLSNTQDDQTDQVQQLNEQNIIKLDISTTSMEPEDKAFRQHTDNFQIRQHTTMIEKKYKKKSPFQQLSKTSKLKLSKITFLSQCHQREVKLKEKQNQHDLRRDSWIYKPLQ